MNDTDTDMQSSPQCPICAQWHVKWDNTIDALCYQSKRAQMFEEMIRDGLRVEKSSDGRAVDAMVATLKWRNAASKLLREHGATPPKEDA